MIFEAENIEFKSQFTDELYKEVIAFANTDGGVIYIGIDDSGNAVGIENVDDTYTRITNGIRDAVMPDVTMFIKYTLQENKVVRITVSEGSNKPYYLKSKGLKPSGVYIRQGASSAQASFEQIRAMIKSSDGDNFESMRSLEQALTFSYAQNAFDRYGIELSAEKYRTLGVADPCNSLFTNLALVISDQCQHTTKITVFADESNTKFRDSKEFGGSVFRQLDDAFSYLMLCNKTSAAFNGLERVESCDYPEEALREALLNAIVHRDYSFSGSIIINVNDKEIEFISLGGLLPGLSPEDIRSGISQPRNKNLAEIFHRLRLLESYGTGIRRIFSLYNNCTAQPRIEITPNTFKLVLPNMNYAGTKDSTSPNSSAEISPQKQIILDYISVHGSITSAQIQELLNVKRTRAYTLTQQMCSDGLITAVGKGSLKKFVSVT